jgi:Predicted membrane protein
MITPILMLAILSGPWVLLRMLRLGHCGAEAAWGAGFLFLFTASGHFIQIGPMSQMLPSWVPAPEAVVVATGVLEIAIGAAFFFERTRTLAAWSAIAVLVLFFPANVYAAIERVPFGGHAWGPVYLMVRFPVQVAIVAWIWVFVLRPRLASRAIRT